MGWNYRVIDRYDGELAIFSVYYYEDGRIKFVSADPTAPRGYEGNIENLKAELQRYSEALLKPILVDNGNGEYIEKVMAST